MQQGLVVFTHVPKTAGTSINKAVNEALPRGTIIEVNRSLALDLIKKGPIPDRIRFLCGHIMHSEAATIVRPDAIYIAAVRHPVERVLSHYFMRIRDRSDPIDDDIRDDPAGSGFQRFYRERIARKNYGNLCCQYVGGQTAAEAIDSIKQHYSIVWANAETAWQRVAAAFQIEPKPLVSLNGAAVGNNALLGERPKDYFAFLRPSVLDELLAAEREDVLLYEWLSAEHSGLFARPN